MCNFNLYSTPYTVMITPGVIYTDGVKPLTTILYTELCCCAVLKIYLGYNWIRLLYHTICNHQV